VDGRAFEVIAQERAKGKALSRMRLTTDEEKQTKPRRGGKSRGGRKGIVEVILFCDRGKPARPSSRLTDSTVRPIFFPRVPEMKPRTL